MNDPQNPLRHPETGPENSGTSVDSTPGATSGIIVFDRPPLPPKDPLATIAGAIAKGDSMKRRTELFHQAMLPEQK